jgi:hypothetical protein
LDSQFQRFWLRCGDDHIHPDDKPFFDYDAQHGRIALILHLAEGAIGPVTATSALRAAAWCEYLTGHARRIYGLVEAAKVTTARMVSRRLAEGKLSDGFTVRDLVRKQWSGVITTLQAETALAILEENGHVQSQDGINTLGRPTVRYDINPQIKGVER